MENILNQMFLFSYIGEDQVHILSSDSMLDKSSE